MSYFNRYKETSNLYIKLGQTQNSPAMKFHLLNSLPKMSKLKRYTNSFPGQANGFQICFLINMMSNKVSIFSK